MHIITDYTHTLVPSFWRRSSTGWVSGNCQLCVDNGEPRPDTKGRGGFNFIDDGFIYHCFNCGFSTGWAPGAHIGSKVKQLWKSLGASDADVHRMIIELMRENESRSLIDMRIKKPSVTKVTIDWDEMPLPQNSVAMSEFSDFDNPNQHWLDVATYLADRGFDPSDGFYYSTEKIPAKMNYRAILPYYHKDKVVGYSARIIPGIDNKQPKYFAKHPHDFIYNLDSQDDERQFVIVTEGELNAKMIDGISTSGNEISDVQCQIINQLNKKVILIPDRGKSGMKAVNTAISQGWAVSFPPWDSHIDDVNDATKEYGKLATMKTIVDFATSNKTKIKVIARQYCK